MSWTTTGSAHERSYLGQPLLAQNFCLQDQNVGSEALRAALQEDLNYC